MGEPQWARLATLAPATRLAGAFPFLFVLFSSDVEDVPVSLPKHVLNSTILQTNSTREHCCD
jgi:hypothetical protein